MMLHCEAKIDGTWTEIDAEEARALQGGEPKRCKHCQGEVHLYPTEGSTASTAHFGHNIANPGCPTVKHPQPLE